MRCALTITVKVILLSGDLSAQFGPQNIISSDLFTDGITIGGSLQPWDIDGDSDIDILFSDDGSVAWFENQNGLGTFSAMQPIHVGNTDAQLLFDVVDIDGDGDLDVVIYEFMAGPRLMWAEQISPGVFAAPIVIVDGADVWMSLGNAVFAMKSEDVTGNGYADILITVPSGVRLYRNLGGTFAPYQDLLHSPSTQSTVLQIGDIDNDGDMDYVIADGGGNIQAGFNSDGIGTAWSSVEILTGFQVINDDIQLVDVDHDGDLDIVDVRNFVKWAENLMTDGIWGGFQIRIEEIQATYGSGDVGQLHCGPEWSMVYVTWGFNGPPQLITYNDTTGAFSTPDPLVALPHTRLIRMADLNGDGFDDLILANGDENELSWSMNSKGDLVVDIELEPFDTLCAYGSSYALEHASPAGGTWSGPGVTDNTFHPFGPSVDELIYTIYDTLSECSYNASQYIVQIVPDIQGAIISCDTTPVVLIGSPPGGVWGGVADEFGVVDLSCEARPIEDMAAYEMEMVNGSCHALQFIQAFGCMPVNLGPDTTLCQESDPIITYLSNSGTSGPGTLIGYDSLVLDEFSAIGSFYPALHEPGDYVLYGSAGGPGVCTGQDSLVVTIAAPPVVQHGLSFDTLLNTNAPVQLEGGMPAGGTYTLAGSTEPLTSFDPGTSGLGEHVLVYSYFDPENGCLGSDTAFIQVDGGTGIETIEQHNSMFLFPNPANIQITVTFDATRVDRILILDATGRKVSEWSSLTSPAVLEIGHLAPGSYRVTMEHTHLQDQLMLIVE